MKIQSSSITVPALHRGNHIRRASVRLLLAAGLICAALSPEAASAPPDRMTYQGFLVDGSSNPLAPTTPVNYTVVFRIYAVSSGPDAPLWTEQQVVTVDKGNFSVVLGEGSVFNSEPRPALSTLFGSATASDRYLSTTVTVGANTFTLFPRLRLLPSPYAFLATQANQLVNAAGTPYVSVSGTTVNVAGTVNATTGFSGLTAAQVPNLDAAKITTGEFGAARIPATLSGNRNLTGNVGIGTAFNGYQLTLGGNLANTKLALWDNNSSGAFGFGIQSQQFRFHINNSSDRFSFLNAPNGTEVFTVKGGGNVGVGTIDPKTPLHVAGDIYSRGHMFLHAYEGDGSSGIAYIQARDTSGTSSLALQLRTQESGVIREAMRLTPAGRVGINTSSPEAILHVAGSVNSSRNFAYYARVVQTVNVPFVGNVSQTVAATGTVAFGSTQNVPYGIIADSRIGAAEFNAFSDSRIKNIRALSDTQKDLEMVKKLKVTEWTPVDVASEGGTLRKGFIAQEVQELMPEAVSTRTDFIPDFYDIVKTFEHDSTKQNLTVTHSRNYPLKKGEVIRIASETTILELPVVEVVSDRKFVLGNMQNKPEKVFIFGRKVSDFRVLNYDRVFTAGIGAIQELNKQVQSDQAKIATLEAEVTALKKQLAAQAEAGSALEARFNLLEKSLKTALIPQDDKAVSTASVSR